MAFCSSPFNNYHRVARRSAPFFGPSSAQAEFAPFLRMFNELDNFTSGAHNNRQALRSFQPRFDVREEQDAYHLQGELPGIEQKDINIEFVDQTTLVVRGQTVRERQAGTPPKAVAEGEQQHQEPKAAIEQDGAEKAQSDNDAASDSGSNYHRPSVEEAQDEDWTDAAPTPATTAAETTTEVAAATKPAEEAPVAEQEQKQQESGSSGHYWVSERSVGQFQRAFNFSAQIDQDAVTANLKNGILSIVVPKVQPRQPRKITVQ